MVQRTLFSSHQGSGYITDTFEEMKKLCTIRGVKSFCEIPLKANEPSDMCGFFKTPLLLLGVLKKTKTLIFYIGEHNNKFYFQEVFWIAPTRFFLLYAGGSGRDYHYRNNIWDYNKPRIQKNAKKTELARK